MTGTPRPPLGKYEEHRFIAVVYWWEEEVPTIDRTYGMGYRGSDEVVVKAEVDV